MTSSLRDSRVPWIGRVPIHWPVCALTYRYEVQLGKMLDAKRVTGSNLAPYLRNTDVQWGRINVDDLPEMDFDVGDREKYALRAGDILVCEGGDVGRAATWDHTVECFYQKALHRLRPYGDGDHPPYFVYALRCAAASGAFTTAEKSTIAHLPADSLRQHRFPFPPLGEQIAIASYLDAETKRIDGLIEEKRKLLALLEEARFAAVERAIRPSSGFRAQPLKRFVEALSTGPFGSALHSSDYIAGGISVINPTHIINGQVVPDDEVSIAEEMAEALSAYRLKPNDIVIGRRGEMGRCAVVPFDANDWLCGTGCLMCTPDGSKVLPEYLQLVISSRASREWLSLESVGTTMENLNTEILGRLPCFVPTIEEQLERLRESSQEIAGLASLKAHVDSEMNLLQELRSSTITDAVLGRIDVRPT